MRLARDASDISTLVPDWVDGIADLPYSLHQAVHLALYWLSFDELDKDERPPRDIWLDEDKMTRWWEEVDRTRREKYSGDGGGSSTEMTRNAAMDDLIR